MLKYIVKYYLAKNLACIRKVHIFYKNEIKVLCKSQERYILIQCDMFLHTQFYQLQLYFESIRDNL